MKVYQNIICEMKETAGAVRKQIVSIIIYGVAPKAILQTYENPSPTSDLLTLRPMSSLRQGSRMMSRVNTESEDSPINQLKRYLQKISSDDKALGVMSNKKI